MWLKKNYIQTGFFPLSSAYGTSWQMYWKLNNYSPNYKYSKCIVLHGIAAGSIVAS